MDWDQVFDVKQKRGGASSATLDRFVSEVGRPITAPEIREVNQGQQNPFPPTDTLHAAYRPFDPSAWVIPNGPLPPSYLSFLRWSDGGQFGTGERWFQFFDTRRMRSMMLAHSLPQYMPGALPFALNGGGVFYLFDMRKPPAGGEYPIVGAHAGYLSWDPPAWRSVADSFPDACRGTTNIESLWE
jgi:hypothetical protein